MLFRSAEIIREKGTNRSQFFRGEIDKYGWVDMGSSFLPSDILAAYLWAQLENWTSIMSRRRKIWDTYYAELKDWAEKYGVGVPQVPSDVQQSYHMFYLVLPDLQTRTQLIEHLNQRNIKAVFHYQALNTSPMGIKLGGQKGQCPISEQMSDRLVRLPFHNGLSDVEVEYVICALREFSISNRDSKPSSYLAA